MQAPVFRELYSEKRVVLEERRMRVDDSPMGRFQEGFAGEAMTNNYRRPVIGYPADLALLGRNEVQGFFNKHYGPQRLCIAIVGDVQTEAVRTLHFPPSSCISVPESTLLQHVLHCRLSSCIATSHSALLSLIPCRVISSIVQADAAIPAHRHIILKLLLGARAWLMCNTLRITGVSFLTWCPSAALAIYSLDSYSSPPSR